MLTHLDALVSLCVVLLLGSLLVTVVTQIVISVFNLRGRNLFWGLNRLLHELQPGVKDEIDEIVHKLLTFPLIAKAKNRYATVIRVEELSKLLLKFSEYPQKYKLSESATEWITHFTKIDEEKLAEQIGLLPDNLEDTLQKNLLKIYRAISRQLQQSREKLIDLEDWFDKISDRMSERFSLHSKIISISASLIVAFSMQLNSIDLIQNIYADADLRARLVSSTDIFLEKGEQLLAQRSTFNIAMDSLSVQHKEFQLPSAPAFTSRIAATSWLRQSAPPDVNIDSLTEIYNQLLDKVTVVYMGQLGQEALALRDQLNNLGLKMLDEHYSWDLNSWPIRKYFGIVISVVLLSLGAPFWFNALKNLANLRSKIVQKEEMERQQRNQNRKSDL